jgi:hypothetical protein
MRPTLADIEHAVRANFVINPNGAKKLETDDKREWHTKSAGRMVFIGVALENGIRREEICAHIDMSTYEYNGRLMHFREHLAKGQKKNAQRSRGKKYDQEEALDLDLRIYRKYILVKNCIEILKRKRLILF